MSHLAGCRVGLTSSAPRTRAGRRRAAPVGQKGSRLRGPFPSAETCPYRRFRSDGGLASGRVRRRSSGSGSRGPAKVRARLAPPRMHQAAARGVDPGRRRRLARAGPGASRQRRVTAPRITGRPRGGERRTRGRHRGPHTQSTRLSGRSEAGRKRPSAGRGRLVTAGAVRTRGDRQRRGDHHWPTPHRARPSVGAGHRCQPAHSSSQSPTSGRAR
jgi:hypothetical protein